jgi:3-dehydroquinate synthase
MALDCRYAVLAGMLAEPEQLRVQHLLERLGFRLYDEALSALDASETPAVLAGLREFQEHLGGELTITLLTGIGQSLEVHALDHARIASALAWLEQRDHARAALSESITSVTAAPEHG